MMQRLNSHITSIDRTKRYFLLIRRKCYLSYNGVLIHISGLFERLGAQYFFIIVMNHFYCKTIPAK